MASTVKQVIASVVRELGEDITDPMTEDQFLTYFRDAVEELVNETKDWRFLHGTSSFSTASGSATYNLGTLIADVLGVVRDTNNLTLGRTEEVSLGRRGFDIEESGSPTNYMITSWTSANGPQIRLWPVPTAVETMTVYRTTDPAAYAITDTVDLPNATFFVIRHHIRGSFYLTAGVTAQYDRYRQLYNVGVGNLRRKFANATDADLTFKNRDIPKGQGGFRDGQLPGDYPRI